MTSNAYSISPNFHPSNSNSPVLSNVSSYSSSSRKNIANISSNNELLAAARFDWLTYSCASFHGVAAHELPVRLGLKKQPIEPKRGKQGGYLSVLGYCYKEDQVKPCFILKTNNEMPQNVGCVVQIPGGNHDLIDKLKKDPFFQGDDRYTGGRVARVDVAIDFDFPNSYEILKNVMLAVKRGKLRRHEELGNTLSGRTSYFGERKATLFTRLYERGKRENDLAKDELYSKDWVRLEFEFKPQPVDKHAFVFLNPGDTIRTSPWACAVIEAIGTALGAYTKSSISKIDVSALNEIRTIHEQMASMYKQYSATAIRYGLFAMKDDIELQNFYNVAKNARDIGGSAASFAARAVEVGFFKSAFKTDATGVSSSNLSNKFKEIAT